MYFLYSRMSFLPDWQMAACVHLAPLHGHLTLTNYGTEYEPLFSVNFLQLFRISLVF